MDSHHLNLLITQKEVESICYVFTIVSCTKGQVNYVRSTLNVNTILNYLKQDFFIDIVAQILLMSTIIYLFLYLIIFFIYFNE